MVVMLLERLIPVQLPATGCEEEEQHKGCYYVMVTIG